MTPASSPPLIKSNKDARKIVSLLESGNATLAQEMVDGKRQLRVLSKSGSLQAIIDPKYAYQVAGWLATCGSGDGLFPGFSQTTRPAQ